MTQTNPTNRKFTDQQFLNQYNKGLYDTEIAYIFQVARTAIEKRRWKLNLLPNYMIRTSTITNPAQHRKEIQLKWNRYFAPQQKVWVQKHPEQIHKNQRRRYWKNREKRILASKQNKQKNAEYYAYYQYLYFLNIENYKRSIYNKYLKREKLIRRLTDQTHANAQSLRYPQPTQDDP